MSEFLAAYGLWLLIALLAIIVIAFLLSGRKKDVITPAAPLAATRPDPVVAPEPELPPLPPIAEPDPQPVAVEPVSPPIVGAPIVAVPASQTPAPAAAPIPISPAGTSLPDAPEPADDLLLLKGVGPKLATLLIDLGVTRFAQIAAWTDTDLAAVDAKLGNFKGRPVRDQWIDQAKYLAVGDKTGFEAKYGKL